VSKGEGFDAVKRFLTIGGVTIAFALAPAGADAATISVTGTDDDVEDGGICSLREAVTAANLNGAGSDPVCGGDTAGADTIVLHAGQTYLLSRTFAVEDGNVWNDLDITGPTTITTDGGLATIDGNGGAGDKDRAIDVLPTAGAVTLERLRVQNGFVNSFASELIGGGGIQAQAALTVVDSEITGNHVQGTFAFGGGIRVRGSLGSLTMLRSTVAGNTAQATGGAGSSTEAVGAGILVYNGAQFAKITNSTISGNTSTGNANGPGLVGGVFVGDGSVGNNIPATLTSNTITQNNATAGGALTGGLQIVAGTMSGNIVAGNTADNDPQDCFGNPTSSLGGNIIGIDSIVASCGGAAFDGPGDLVGTAATPINPNLGALLPNGGLTRTRAVNPGSVAIDRGGTCPATDQRGFFRAPVAPCDSGAFELNAPTSLPVVEVPVTQPPPAVLPTVAPPGPTGLRAAALAKCKKKPRGPKRQKCRKKANQLPV
jgi:CSLREA domain-containing protein